MYVNTRSFWNHRHELSELSVIVFTILYIIATYISWETDLNKSLGLLSESQFVSSVQMIVYVFMCLYVKSLSNKNMFKLNYLDMMD